MSTIERPEWDNADIIMAQASYMACAYNAAVNYGSERGPKKMGDLIRAINLCERTEGRAKLQWLVDKGVVDGFSPCPPACEMRPGGLFHEPGCENDFNHPVSRARREAARRALPERQVWAASPSLVGAS